MYAGPFPPGRRDLGDGAASTGVPTPMLHFDRVPFSKRAEAIRQVRECEKRPHTERITTRPWFEELINRYARIPRTANGNSVSTGCTNPAVTNRRSRIAIRKNDQTSLALGRCNPGDGVGRSAPPGNSINRLPPKAEEILAGGNRPASRPRTEVLDSEANPMAYVDKRDPDLLVFRSGGGLLVLFGLPFLLAGLFVIALTLELVSIQGEVPPIHVGLPFGGVFAAVGAGIVFGRAGVTVDRRRQSLVKWWGLLGLAKRSEYFLPDFCEVVLRKEVRKGDKSSYTVYPVCLRSETLEKSVALEEPRDYAAARALAERVAKLIDKPLADSSSGTPVVRQPDCLDLSLREAARRSGVGIEVPDPPPQMRSVVSIEGSRVSIEIPASGIQGAHKLVLGMLFAFLALEVPFLLPIGARADSSGWADLPLFVAFSVMVFLVPVVTVAGFLFSASRKRVLVGASTGGLRVEERAPLLSSVTEISGHEIEELEFSDVEANLSSQRDAQAKARFPSGASGPKQFAIPPMLRSLLHLLGRGGKITARSDRDSVSFGNGLSNGEAEYLVAVIKRALVG
jgi:hypothetical protein